MALTPKEEQFLKQMVKDHTPAVVVNPQPHKNFETIVRDDRIADDAALGRKDPKMKPVSLEDDGEWLRRVRHTVLKNEKLGQWVARTMLPRAQCFSMSREEIQRWVDASAERSEDCPEPKADLRFNPPGRPQPVCRTILLTD
jgi:hypothetical protein